MMDDLISRQDVLHELDWCDYGLKDWQKWKLKMMVRDIPSAEPERKMGKWNPFDVPWYQCSVCGAVREQKTFMENFCPNCGADMRGEENDS